MELMGLTQSLNLFKEHRFLIFRSVANDIKRKNAGSVLGNWWYLVSPIILLGVYTVVYLVIFKLRPVNMTQMQYIIYMFSGLLPFLSIAETLSLSLSSLSSNKNLLKNTVFPHEIIPLKDVLSTQPGFLVGTVILMGLNFYFNQVGPSLLLLPVIYLFQLAFLIGAAWILSLINLIFKDLQNLITYIIMVLMLMSPIAYVPEMIPEHLRFLIWLNPVAYFILSYQKVIVDGVMPPLNYFLPVIFIGTFFYLFGFWTFKRIKPSLVHYA